STKEGGWLFGTKHFLRPPKPSQMKPIAVIRWKAANDVFELELF
ncbi:unnamed protein product, partial [Larinioides sclopetarius]